MTCFRGEGKEKLRMSFLLPPFSQTLSYFVLACLKLHRYTQTHTYTQWSTLADNTLSKGSRVKVNISNDGTNFHWVPINTMQ